MEIELWSDQGFLSFRLFISFSFSKLCLFLFYNIGEYYVQVKYQGEPLTLSGCSDALCPLGQFMAHVEPIISVNYAQACVAKK